METRIYVTVKSRQLINTEIGIASIRKELKKALALKKEVFVVLFDIPSEDCIKEEVNGVQSIRWPEYTIEIIEKIVSVIPYQFEGIGDAKSLQDVKNQNDYIVLVFQLASPKK